MHIQSTLVFKNTENNLRENLRKQVMVVQGTKETSMRKSQCLRNFDLLNKISAASAYLMSPLPKIAYSA